MATRRRQPAAVPVYRFLMGAPMSGELRTNATFLRAPTRALHPTADRSWWHWRPGWHRAAIRAGVVAFAAALAAGVVLELAVTEAVLASCAAAAAGYGGWRVWRMGRSWVRACTWDGEHPWRSGRDALILPWQHYAWYHRPARHALTAELGVPPHGLSIALDRSRVTVRLPHEFTGGDKQKDAVARTVAAKLALEAAEPSWKLHGRRPRVTFTLSDPLPGRLTWEDMAADIASTGPDELLAGAGKKNAVVRVSLKDDSPHFGISAGTGGGKSALAALWLLQELRRGGIALILDAKRFSHPWAFKDMDAEYGLLPNVGYCRSVTDLYDGMCWLGGELDRRNQVAERAINAKGDVLGDVGPRLFIIAEEMNLAHGPLKQHWAQIRGRDDPKKSPAFTGLGAVSFAGRAVKMHLVVIGQMLKAEVLGGGDVRENIGVRMLTRYTQNSWKMQAGDIPMPPPSKVPGRWQCLASGAVAETQVPLVDMGQARELAVSGLVTRCPAGMPGRAGAAVPDRPVPSPMRAIEAPDLRVVVGQAETVAVGLTIKEALDDGIFGVLGLDAARKRVQRARLEAAGQRGDGSYTYSRADLFRAARTGRKDPAA